MKKLKKKIFKPLTLEEGCKMGTALTSLKKIKPRYIGKKHEDYEYTW